MLKRKFQPNPVKSSERIRAKRQYTEGQRWSTIASALKYDSESEMDSSFASTSNYADEGNNEDTIYSDPEDAATNPMWQLFEAVRNCTNSQGVALSDPFMRLPSRRFYPDYYEEIKHPLSLAKIRARIKTGLYDTATQLVDDLNLIFENAKKYNRPDSKIFKDACRLQKLMQTKAQDLAIIPPSKDSDSSESDDEDSRGSEIKKRGRKSLLNAMLSRELKEARRSQQDVDSQLKKRMRYLYKVLVEYTDETGRTLIDLFMEKPSKKLYPDYYDIIANPIDMRTIEANIKWERYFTEEMLLSDFKLMFNNCKQYNEDNSQIYKDAVRLESVLMEKLKELGPFQPTKWKRKPRNSTLVQNKLKTLYNTVKDYVDAKGRQLSTIFLKLPSKTELPNYYEVIKKPLDLEKIGVRLKNGVYDSLEDLLADVILMLDNACKYNEPDSQIYKDALTLQQIALQTKLELADDNENGVPDVKALIQELLTSLFITVYNHQDEEGRSFSDSILELSEVIKPEDSEKPLNFDIIKRNLDKGKYRRLDRFQQDMFEVFERARKVSRTDSQAFEDSIELQTFFIRQRNELCKFGELLKSNALSYTEEKLNESIEAIRREKIPKEQELEQELEEESKIEEKEPEETAISSEIIDELKDLEYNVGDFVYIEPREKTMEPHIIHIQKIQKDSSGEIWIYGCWFFRPYETFHIASKKFLEKEVFKSDSCNSTPYNQIVGKCFVMFVKDYFRIIPEGFDDKDVYVCESRYFTRTKTFKKIKVWPIFDNIQYKTRENPLPMVRVPSIFKDQADKHRNDIDDFEEDKDPKVLDIERSNVICDPPEGVVAEEGSVFYEQFNIPSGAFKLGDCCYVRTDQGRNLICRIDRIWVDKDGMAFFHGPWFVQQQELPTLATTNKSFYPQEVFLSSIEDTNPLLSICDRCAVMEFKDYIARRPTEILEKDVYLCESRYLEHERKFVKLNKGLIKFTFNNSNVIGDEVYIFRKPLCLEKVDTNGTTQPVIARKGQNSVDHSVPSTPKVLETDNEESSNDQASIPAVEHPVVTPTLTVKKKIARRLVTGYIIFASEVRKSVVQANPECSFGDVSRIIGTEWKNLPQETKAEYEKKAQKQNEESAKQAADAAAAAESLPHSPASAHSQIENAIYECHWENKCDFQFEDAADLLDHLTSEPNGHVWQSFGEMKDKEGAEFQCLFHGCGRVKKGATPFPSLQRLVRHCKEVHVSKQNPKSIAPENRKSNFVPSRKNVTSPLSSSNNSAPHHPPPQMTISNAILQSRSTPSPALSNSEMTSNISSMYPTLSQAIGFNNQSSNMPNLSPFWAASTGVQVKPVEPIFVGTIPRTNRLLHSHTYLKYIERLKPDVKHVSNWKTQMTATSENTPLTDVNRLPAHWLANGPGNHGNVINALWALRHFMMKDALNLYSFNQD